MVATTEPKSIFAGDAIAWKRNLDDYPASTYTLTYYFSNEQTKFEIVATADGDDHSVAVAATTSADYKSGRFRWWARVDDGAGDVQTVDNGWIEIYPDPTDGPRDYRTHARIMLDAIEAALEGQASKNQLDLINYSIGVTNVSRDRELLQKWRDKYTRELRQEEGADAKTRHIKLRFTSP